MLVPFYYGVCDFYQSIKICPPSSKVSENSSFSSRLFWDSLGLPQSDMEKLRNIPDSLEAVFLNILIVKYYCIWIPSKTPRAAIYNQLVCTTILPCLNSFSLGCFFIQMLIFKNVRIDETKINLPTIYSTENIPMWKLLSLTEKWSPTTAC